MSKTELVNKIINRVGVPEADVKILLEVLLNKLAETLKTGDSAEIEGIGTFHFIKGELQKREDTEDSNKETVLNLIAFSPSKNFDPDSDGNLIFNVPDPALGNYSAVDSFFTLSAGKPIIPLDQNPNGDLFLPRSEIEKWSLIESKAEKLLTEVTIWKDNIEPGKFIKLKEGDINEEKLKDNQYDEKNKKDDEDLDLILRNNLDENFNDENISWEFGNENSKQFRDSISKNNKNSTAQIKKDFNENEINEDQNEKTTNQNEGVNWEFGGSKFRDKLKQEKIDLTEEHDFKTEEETERDINKNDKIKNKDEINNNRDYFELNQLKPENEPENSLGIDLPEEDFEIPKYEVQEEEKIGNFQRVKSLNSEFGGKDLEKNVINKITWETTDNDQKYSEDSPKNTKHEFIRVQSKTTEFGYDLDDLKSLNYKKINKVESPELTDDSKKEINIEEPDVTDSFDEQEQHEIPEFEKNIEEVTRIEPMEFENNLEEKKTKPIELDDDFEEEKNIELSGERTKQMQDLEDKDEAIKEAFDFVTKKRELIEEYSEPKRKKGAVIAASIFGIIIITVAVIMIFGPHSEQMESVQQVKKGNETSFETVISRNYDIPVEYPYSPNEAALKSSFDVISPSVFKPQTKTPDVQKSNVQTSSTPKKETGKEKKVDKPQVIKTPKLTTTNKSDISKNAGVKVEQYIFKYGDNYVVQVSSWPSRSKANEQVQLYNRRGFHSFIEEADIPGRGTWYRVKVGDFKSLNQARNFFNGNK